MATRGFQGDTMSTLLLMAAGILVWQKLSRGAEKVGDKLSDTLELGKNSGGIFQTETTEEISSYQQEVDSWHCNWNTISKARRTQIKGLANKIYTHVKDHSGLTSNIDQGLIISLHKGLNPNELKALAISFGVKDINHVFGMTAWTGHIFHLFEVAFEGYFNESELAQLRRIWAPTGFWV